MAETGFGSISFSPAPTYKDWGFGSNSPSSFSGRDTGFGSPYDPSNANVTIEGSFADLPDDGGIRLEIQSDWDSFTPFADQIIAGTFKVTCIKQSNGNRTLANGLFGKDCYTDINHTSLIAYIPPLPHGGYNLEISWNFGVISISNAFNITLRARCLEFYRYSKRLPNFVKNRSRIFENEKITVFAGYTNLESIAKTAGDALQKLAGRPCTALTSNYTHGEVTLNVESTLGFPDSGSLFLDQYRLTYTSKSATAFSGVSSSLYTDTVYPPRQKVILDAYSVINY
tara:strand:+ start:63 stop:914 length:852 start_codon:yes stop_codon:yes gene_type:complete